MASLASVIVMVMGSAVNALHMTKMPANLQTTKAEPLMRKISLKLPLQQPMFHWTFMSKEEFLAGKLVLRITRKDQTVEIIIFENKKLSDGWELIEFKLPGIPKAGECYFGIQSSKKYATAPNDKLEIELHVKKDLKGIGALQTGILPAGTYKSRGTYSGLLDKYKVPNRLKNAPKKRFILDQLRKTYEFRAFLENWKQQWELKITGEKGWLSPKQRQQAQKRLKQMQKEQKTPNQKN